MLFFLCLLQLAIAALAFAGGSELRADVQRANQVPRTTTAVPTPAITPAAAALNLDANVNNDKACKRRTSSTSSDSVVCVHNADAQHDIGTCICTSGTTTVTHSETSGLLGKCPSTIPESWLPTTTHTTSHPTSMTKGEIVGYPYTSWNMKNGLCVACESSAISVVDVGLPGRPPSITTCVGSSTTLTPPITYITTATIVTASPVLAGNWISKASESTITNTASEREVLASSIYSALSKVCSESGTTTVTTVPKTSWLSTDSPDMSMTIVDATETMTKCSDAKQTNIIDIWDLPAGNSSDETEKDGLSITVADSLFDGLSLNQWMWTIAFTYAQAAMNSTVFDTYIHRDAESGFVEPVVIAQHYLPSEVHLSYKASFDVENDLEYLETRMDFQPNPDNTLDCEILKQMVGFFADFIEVCAPEVAPEIRAATAEGEAALDYVCEAATHNS